MSAMTYCEAPWLYPPRADGFLPNGVPWSGTPHRPPEADWCVGNIYYFVFVATITLSPSFKPSIISI